MEAPAPDLKSFIRDQRILSIAIWPYVASIGAGLLLPSEASNYLIGFWVIVLCCAAFAVVRIVKQLSGWIWAIVATLTIFIPLFGLIPLFIVNGNARTHLEQQGVTVGMFGAK